MIVSSFVWTQYRNVTDVVQNRIKLGKEAVVMHCNLRLHDVMPVVLCFNYGTNNASAYQILTQSDNVHELLII